MTTRVLARAYRSRQDAGEELLTVTHYQDSSGNFKYDYYVSNSDPTTPLKELSRVIITEHRIEELFRRAKGEAGLADYEVRKWGGWYHHQTLSMIALWFLTLETLRGKKYTSALTISEIRDLLALLLRRSYDRLHPGWENRFIERKSIRRELARFYHYRRLNLLAPQRVTQLE